MNTSESPFPIISVEGSPYDCGYQYGCQCGSLIAKSIETYQKAFKDDLNLDWKGALDLGKKFGPDIEDYDPDGVEEMRGIAKGAGRTFEEILVLQSKTELKFLASVGDLEGCTTLAATAEATLSKCTIVGKNWDWIPESQKLGVVLKKKRKGKPNSVALTEAGLLTRDGFNSAGLCIVANALASDKWRIGVPLHIILNKIISSSTLNDAMTAVLSAKRASSNNYMIVHSMGEAITIEAAPCDYNVIWAKEGMLVHSNHFTVPNPNIRDLLPNLHPNTLTRLERATKLLAREHGRIDNRVLKNILMDHFDKPFSICWHPDESIDPRLRLQTNASFIVNLNQRTIEIALGPPCKNEYVSLKFPDIMD